MCLIFLSVQNHPRYKLIIVANRDEFYQRRTSAAQWWQDQPDILGGRDLEAGGTWMGVSRVGKIALVTNYRDLKNIRPNAPSRGHLVSDFLENKNDPEVYVREIERKAGLYNGFNLLTGTVDELWYISNYKKGYSRLQPGLHGLSNHLLDTPWPKVVRGKEKMKTAMLKDVIVPSELMDILYDDVLAKDDQLPDTGIGLDRERALSSMFIKTPGYGTRCSTVILVDQKNHLLFSERIYNTSTFQHTTSSFEFNLNS